MSIHSTDYLTLPYDSQFSLESSRGKLEYYY